MVFQVYCIVAGVAGIAIVIYLLINLKKIKRIKNQPLTNEEPPIAIIIAVRNEEEDLEKALQSVCNINYQNYRIIAVNDRSTDGTAEILERVKKQYPKLTVTTIDTLPHGWLGKNNALYQGYLSSTEEWLLFTDADIEYHPDTINKAMGYTLKHGLDNLAVLPEVKSRSTLLNSVLATFSMMLMIYLRPWDARNPKSKAFVGVGAFMLVKRTAYEKAGTHVRIKLRPDDDVKLGANIKHAGLRQDVLGGNGALKLEWYKNLSQFINGLMKNSFAQAEYNVFLAVLYILATLLFVALPIPLMLVFGTLAIRLLAGVCILFMIIYMVAVKPNKWWYAFMIPFAGSLMVYILIRAMIITLKQGGIYWRDSFYPLDLLKGKDK